MYVFSFKRNISMLFAFGYKYQDHPFHLASPLPTIPICTSVSFPRVSLVRLPPKPHEWVSLPLESKIFIWTNIKIHCTLPKIFTGLTMVVFLYIVRAFLFETNYMIAKEYFVQGIGITITLLEDNIVKVNVPSDLLLGIFAIISRLLVLGFWEELFREFLPKNLTMFSSAAINPNLHMVQGGSPQPESSGSATGSGSKELESRGSKELVSSKSKESGVGSSEWSNLLEIKDNLKLDLRMSIYNQNSLTGWLKDCNQNRFSQAMHLPEEGKIVFAKNMLQAYEDEIKKHMASKDLWMNKYKNHFSPQARTEYQTITLNLVRGLERLNNDVFFSGLNYSNKTMDRSFLIEMRNKVNEYGKKELSEVNKLEKTILDEIRKSQHYKTDSEFKRILGVELQNSNQEYRKELSDLKQNLESFINGVKKN